MISELDLIERIARATSVRPGVTLGIGDDAAVLDGDPPTVVTQDLLVDGVHFRSASTGFRDLGHKALAVNLSDLAAMGAHPVAAFVGLGLPEGPEVTLAAIDDLYEGMEALAAAHGATIAGGDITRAPALVIAVTAVGHPAPGVAPLRRAGAGPGDLLCVTGSLGAAAAGLLLLDDPVRGTGVPEAEALRDAYRRPTPRMAAGRCLAAGGATAMLDCSDGLALDASRLARSSGVAIEIDLERVPIAPGVARVAAAAGREPDVLAVSGGDDYELIATIPSRALPDLSRALDVPLTPLGRVIAAPVGITLLRRGEPVELTSMGWAHRTG